ncbi:MAG: biotin/lipoyl-binding protein, partial [Rhodoferax sp.]|nr:biotin/lipoyl-binding protein [Rhodoferax sp.]
PLRARSLLRLAAAALLIMLVWAVFAKIDEVTRGEARVVPTSQVQIIQSVDGGVVEALLVKEGQIVEAGQLLLRVDSTRFVSTLMESQVSQASLQAKALRLEALTRGTPFNPPKELVRDAPDVIEQERRLYESRRAEISAQTAIYQSQLVQRQQELNEVRARRDQAERSMALMNQEINATRPMVATGAVSEV